jgi:hypothetical protein
MRDVGNGSDGKHTKERPIIVLIPAIVAPVVVADAEVKVLGASERAELVQASGMSGAQ